MRTILPLLFLAFSTQAVAQWDRLSGSLSGGAYLPIVQEVTPNIDGEAHRASFGWPEVDGNLYFSLFRSSNDDRDFLSVYAGGTYRNMFGLEETGDGPDFEGSMSMSQFRAGVLLFELVRVSYVGANISADGISEGVFTTTEYGGPALSQSGYEIGLEASKDGNMAGIYLQNSFAPSTGTDVPFVEWTTFEANHWM